MNTFQRQIIDFKRFFLFYAVLGLFFFFPSEAQSKISSCTELFQTPSPILQISNHSIITPRLELLPIASLDRKAGEIDALIKIQMNSQVQKLAFGSTFSKADVRENIRDAFPSFESFEEAFYGKSKKKKDHTLDLVVRHKETMQIIGVIELQSIADYEMDLVRAGVQIHHQNWLGIGFYLHPDSWGKGYASEASRAVIHYFFEYLRGDGLVGTVHLNNAPSQRVMEKSGFLKLKTPSSDGEYIYILNRPE